MATENTRRLWYRLEGGGFADGLGLWHDGRCTKVTISGHGAFLPEAQVDAAKARIAALEAALDKLWQYARHTKDCDVVTEHHPKYNPCSCGLDEIRREKDHTVRVARPGLAPRQEPRDV